ncbi:Uncharacterised protein [Mycobacteroides abscessus subsp. bolletii]|nr:Uncharacterised protein [Mycobacteroides abscessus subsp. bolletii]
MCGAVSSGDLRRYKRQRRAAAAAVCPTVVWTIHTHRHSVGVVGVRAQCRWAATGEGDRGTRVVLPARRGVLGTGAGQHGQVLRQRRHQQLRGGSGRGRQTVRRRDAPLLRRPDGKIQGRQQTRHHHHRPVVRPLLRAGVRKPRPQGLLQLSEPGRKHGHRPGHGIHPSRTRHRQDIPAAGRSQDLRHRPLGGRQ